MESKQCTKCGEIKPVELFHKDKSRLDGRTSSCAACRTKQSVEHFVSNKAWRRDSNKDFNKKRMQDPENKKKAVHASTKWQRANPEKSVPYNRANASMRRVAERYPEALDCDINDILFIYEQAFELEQQTGIRHHVDHKRPLAAGGLHNIHNLEVIPEHVHKEKTRQEQLLMRQLMTEYYEETFK